MAESTAEQAEQEQSPAWAYRRQRRHLFWPDPDAEGVAGERRAICGVVVRVAAGGWRPATAPKPGQCATCWDIADGLAVIRL